MPPLSPPCRGSTRPRRAAVERPAVRRDGAGRRRSEKPGGLIVAAPVEPGPGGATGALGRRLLDEHRPVTSVFLALPDMGVPRDGAARLQDYLAVAMPVIQRYDGELRQVDAGDKGYQLVIGFGAPRTAADDAERAVGCCLELVRLPSAQGRAGVATGPAFCAEVGTHRSSRVRRDRRLGQRRGPAGPRGRTGRDPHRRRHVASVRGLRPATPAGTAAGEGAQRPRRGLRRGGAAGDDERTTGRRATGKRRVRRPVRRAGRRARVP